MIKIKDEDEQSSREIIRNLIYLTEERYIGWSYIELRTCVFDSDIMLISQAKCLGGAVYITENKEDKKQGVMIQTANGCIEVSSVPEMKILINLAKEQEIDDRTHEASEEYEEFRHEVEQKVNLQKYLKEMPD
jgi:glycerol kinase